jgi:lactate permease
VLPLETFTQILAPIAGSVYVSALVAAIPLVVLFVLLGVFKAPAWISSLATLVACVILAIAGWQMPVGMALSVTAEGIFFGAAQIMWLLMAALWLYNLTVKMGWDRVLRDLMGGISTDLRVLSILIAFGFGALIEGIAGFGTPVAITAAMLAAMGVPKIKAAALCLLANTAPVAFGSVGAPITALGNSASAVGGPGMFDPAYLSMIFGQMAGRQSPFMAIFVPLLLLVMVDGKRGLKDAWHIGLIAGFSFAIAQFVAANYISYMVTDVISAGVMLLVTIVALRWVKPKNLVEADIVQEEEHELLPAQLATGGARVWGAVAPYAIIISIFGISQIPPIKAVLSQITYIFPWPGLEECKNAAGTAPCVTVNINLYSVLSTGVYLAIAALITTAVYRMKLSDSLAVFRHTVYTLRYTIITIGSVLGVAYVMNASGMTISLGTALASAGAAFTFVSPILGWLGVAITGSDTSANALFGGMQVAAAQAVWPGSIQHEVLMASSNSTGGAMGKMISPQSLAVGIAAAGLMNQEGILFRKLIGWSIAMVLVFGLLVLAQSTVFLWMVPIPGA